VESIHQFQRVSVFNRLGAQQQRRHIEFIMEGNAACWLSGLNPRPNTIGGILCIVLPVFGIFFIFQTVGKSKSEDSVIVYICDYKI
jgi:hypothetical protein